MAASKHHPENKAELTYIQKVWQTVGIVALLVVTILIVRVAFDILLMVLAGSLIAVYFHGLGDTIQRRTKLQRKAAMLISIISTVILLGALFWFMGTKIQQQVAELSNTLPHTLNTAKAKLSQTAAGQKVLESFSGNNSQKLTNTVQGFSVPHSVYWEICMLFYSWGYFSRLTHHFIKMVY
jgi:predicted PurR-regulated permease PerM